jgi:hypothetical protein
VQQKDALYITEGEIEVEEALSECERLGSVTSSINSPNVSLEARQAIGSKRRNVNEEQGSCAIGLGWLYKPLFAKDSEGKEIAFEGDKPLRIPCEFYRENEAHEPSGNPSLLYHS